MTCIVTGSEAIYKPVFSDHFSVCTGSEETERYTLPELLEEKMTICKPGEKPLLVVYFVKVLNYRRILCFTGSIEATHRLVLAVIHLACFMEFSTL